MSKSSLPLPALQLVEFLDGQAKIPEAARSLLKETPQHVVVVGVGGPARTGKSTLLSFLANFGSSESKSVFRVANSVKSCTQGLWVAPPILQADGTVKLLLDSEGSGQADGTHDVKVLTLALLLSSVFVYNDLGALDSRSVQVLALLANVARQLGDSELVPPLVVVRRDFSLALTGPTGTPLSPDDYLEQSLEPQGDDGDAARLDLRNGFPRRACQLLVRPAVQESQLQQQLDLRSVRPEFLAGLQDLRARVDLLATPKLYQNHKVSGPMLLVLLDHLVEAVNRGAIPVVREAWAYIAEQQVRDVCAKVISELQQQQPDKLLLVPEEWCRRAQSRQETAEQRLRTECMQAPPVNCLADHFAAEDTRYASNLRAAAAAVEVVLSDPTGWDLDAVQTAYCEKFAGGGGEWARKKFAELSAPAVTAQLKVLHSRGADLAAALAAAEVECLAATRALHAEQTVSEGLRAQVLELQVAEETRRVTQQEKFAATQLAERQWKLQLQELEAKVQQQQEDLALATRAHVAAVGELQLAHSRAAEATRQLEVEKSRSVELGRKRAELSCSLEQQQLAIKKLKVDGAQLAEQLQTQERCCRQQQAQLRKVQLGSF